MLTLFVLLVLGSAITRGLRRAWYRPMWGGMWSRPFFGAGWGWGARPMRPMGPRPGGFGPGAHGPMGGPMGPHHAGDPGHGGPRF